MALVPALWTAVIGYFAYHLLDGQYGLMSWLAFEERAYKLQTELVDIKSEREKLEYRVALMRPESLDPDLLEERARQTLGFSRPNEVTIFREPR
jgi:cell division protein FtsB